MKAVFLDRDGVINQDSPSFIRSPAEWISIPGSLEALKELKEAGFAVIVITNQAGIGRGLYTEAQLAEIHQKMCEAVLQAGGKIDKVFYCPHISEDLCLCRKPNPGLLYEAAREFHLELSKMYLVGDSIRDIQAARKAGCIPILVKTGNGRHTLISNPTELNGVVVCEDLKEAASYIIENSEDASLLASG